jgi:hypothetical protein
MSLTTVTQPLGGWVGAGGAGVAGGGLGLAVAVAVGELAPTTGVGSITDGRLALGSGAKDPEGDGGALGHVDAVKTNPPMFASPAAGSYVRDPPSPVTEAATTEPTTARAAKAATKPERLRRRSEDKADAKGRQRDLLARRHRACRQRRTRWVGHGGHYAPVRRPKRF